MLHLLYREMLSSREMGKTNGNCDEPWAKHFLSRRLFDRGNKVEEEYAVTFFLSSWKRYLDEHDFVGEVY